MIYDFNLNIVSNQPSLPVTQVTSRLFFIYTIKILDMLTRLPIFRKKRCPYTR